MKKLLTILLTLLMVFTLVGCNDKKEEEPVVVDTPEVNEVEVEDEPIVGGFVEAEDRTLTDELKEIFNKAREGYTGIGFEPQELYATQVVAGTNYKFVCSGTKTTNPPIRGTYFVTVYKDLQGNCSIIDVETITESAGDVDEDPAVKEVDKTINYWVVFYNPDGSEIQRKAIKYGTQIEYDGDTPQYWDNDYWYKFVCWTDKQGNEIKEFPKVSGNHYYYAKYEMGGEHRKEEPAPTPSHVCAKTSTYLVYCNSTGFESNIDVYEFYNGGYIYLKNISDLLITKYSGDLAAGRWSHTDSDLDGGLSIQFTYCDDYEAHTIDPCFVAGTQVQYDLLGNTKNIEDFKVGDQIVSYDVNTNEYYLAKVGKLFIHDGIDKTNKLADVTLEDGSVITMTPNHPVLTTAGFRAIDNDDKPKLQAGQFVMSANGWTMISKINVYDCKPTVTYNLGLIDYDEIVDNDTYDTYVAGGIVVHNIK